MITLILLHIREIIDIIVSAFFIYVVLLFIQQTRSYLILNSFLFLIAVSYISAVFGLRLTQVLFEPLLAFFVIIFVVVFQKEIRRFFRWLSLPGKSQHIGKATNQTEEISAYIVRAVSEMAKDKNGALIVLTGNSPIDDIVEGGFDLDGKISTPLLLSIFDPHTPGHDGAVLIEDHRIKKFGLHLPLAEDFKGFNTMGTRHRAALGITERSDALTIVVSEERGTISVAESGILRTLSDPDDLLPIVRSFLHEDAKEDKSLLNYLVVSNFGSKVLSLGIASLLWLLLFYK